MTQVERPQLTQAGIKPPSMNLFDKTPKIG